MGHAYTPGLRVTARTLVRKRRLLPIHGQVLVEASARVEAQTVVARTELPGRVQTVNAINLLGITPEEIRDYMLVKPGDRVEKDQVLAENRPLISWFKTRVLSPIAGSVETVSEVTGQVLLREPPRPLELTAFMDGRVVEVLPREGVVVETAGAFIQGIFGIGGETWGRLAVAVDGPAQPLTADRVRPEHRGCIVVGGSFVGEDCFRRAREVGVAGLVAGGLHDADLKRLLGYDLGVAITGTERVGFTLVITEGFGQVPMARKTFDLFRSLEGRKASMSGATQIRAGVLRPEVIVPEAAGERAAEPEDGVARRGALREGELVRVIRDPFFGRLGRVRALPQELRPIASGTHCRVLEAEFDGGEVVVIPRANVEIIEG